MDLVLDVCDEYFFDRYNIYPTSWARDDIIRQITSLYLVMLVGGFMVYIIPATLSYYLIFDKRHLEHPQVLENQVSKEIKYALNSIPFIAIPTVAILIWEVRGYSKLYDGIETKQDWLFVAVSCFTFILFTDCLIYWIHYGLHHKWIYKYIHKDHHKWKIPTPFASHAFHPIDGFMQSLPYHIYPFLFPLHKVTYLMLFVFVNFWTVSIHDGDYRVPEFLKPFVNGSAHHTDHHTLYNYNYGQYFTLWDRIGGTFRHPNAFQGDSPLDQVLKKEKKGTDTPRRVTRSMKSD